jgi:Tfp pilus assembly ATPase PilU
MTETDATMELFHRLLKVAVEGNASDLHIISLADGMIAFNQALYNLVKAGRVSETEALAKATNPQALEMNFKGIFLNEGGRIIS